MGTTVMTRVRLNPPEADVDQHGAIALKMKVVSSDGQEVGSVSETRPSHFAVTHGSGSFWLRREDVQESAGGGLRLSFPADELTHHQLTDPGMAGAVPATSRERAYLPGATPEEASDLYDPERAPEGTPAGDEGQQARGAPA